MSSSTAFSVCPLYKYILFEFFRLSNEPTGANGEAAINYVEGKNLDRSVERGIVKIIENLIEAGQIPICFFDPSTPDQQASHKITNAERQRWNNIYTLIILNEYLYINRKRELALKATKLALLDGDRVAAKKAATGAVKVPELLQHRIAVALGEKCEVRLCRKIEADHAILAAFTTGEIEYVLSNDLDFVVAVRK